jgi:LPXTG-motif cell wall-anchored protein
MECIDISAGGEMICPAVPETPLPWILEEIPYTGLDALTLLFIGAALLILGVAILRLRRARR